MPLRDRLALLVILAGLVASSTLVRAAPRPLPPLSAEELELRAIVQPLRAGVTTDESLLPLRVWLDARHAAGKGRAAERELHRVLKRMHDDANRDLLRAAEWVHRLQVQRKKLYTGLTEENAPVDRTVKELNESAPVPDEEELLPGNTGISDAFLFATDAGPDASVAPTPSDPDQEPVDDAGPTIERSPDADMDKERLVNRLSLDLTILGHLLHACDNEYENERDRHRAALAALDAFLKNYGSARNEAS